MAFGVTGMQVDTGTLDTITRGGVAFLTPNRTSSSDEVRPGDMFTLYEKSNPDWSEDAVALNLLTRDPPTTINAIATWKQKQFGLTREHQITASGLQIPGVGGPFFVLPRDVAEAPATAVRETHQVVVLSADGSEYQLRPSTLTRRPRPALVAKVLDPIESYPGTPLPPERFRQPQHLEDCVVIRHSRHEDGKVATMVESLGRHELVDRGQSWLVSTNRLSHRLWHGAAVLSAADEKSSVC